jgi:hypothetical protein
MSAKTTVVLNSMNPTCHEKPSEMIVKKIYLYSQTDILFYEIIQNNQETHCVALVMNVPEKAPTFKYCQNRSKGW